MGHQTGAPSRMQKPGSAHTREAVGREELPPRWSLRRWDALPWQPEYLGDPKPSLSKTQPHWLGVQWLVKKTMPEVHCYRDGIPSHFCLPACHLP